MSVVLEFSMFPLDRGESVGEYVARIVRMIDERGISYQLTPMGTIVETETIEEALELVAQAYRLLEPDCNRVYAALKFDIRKGREDRLREKIASIEHRIRL